MEGMNEPAYGLSKILARTKVWPLGKSKFSAFGHLTEKVWNAIVASHAKERQRSMTKRTAGSERLNEQTNHSLDSSYFLNTVYGKTVVCFA